MPNLNEVTLMGHLGHDAETKSVGSGQVTNLNLATSEKWTGKDGTAQEHVEWHRVECYGKTAEFAGGLKKGQAVYVRGKIHTNKWTAKDGTAKTQVVIRADRIQRLTKAEAASEPSQSVLADEIPF